MSVAYVDLDDDAFADLIAPLGREAARPLIIARGMARDPLFAERALGARAARAVELEDDWRGWLTLTMPSIFSSGFAPHHETFWEWVWAIEADKTDEAFVGVWPRGGAKSSSAEAACIGLGARKRRRYGLYVCATQTQADDHVANIGSLLESSVLSAAYPDLGDRLIGKYGNSKGWRRNRLRTASGFTIDAIGLDTSSRGTKVEEDRPDFMCHAVGTLIYDGNGWQPVETHPGLLGFREEDGLAVRVWGVPDAEIVTKEHRYWARPIRRGAWSALADWVTASELRRDGAQHAVGCPIDHRVDPVRPVWVGETKLRTIESDGTPGWRVREQREVPEELRDTEWWWLIGLYWGDGSVSRGGGNSHAISLSIADTEPEIAERVRAVLAKWGYGWNETQKSGCIALTFSCRWMHRWLIDEWRLLEPTGMYKPGQKAPPEWVERIDLDLQRALLRGYIDADGYTAPSGVTIISVSLLGLLSAKRILARLGVPASIRDLRPALEGVVIAGNLPSNTQRSYDLRMRWGVEGLGIEGILPVTRNSRPSRVWIDDGYLWSAVRSVEESEPTKFAPIETASGAYLTAFGRSHNCFDDLDDEQDSPAATEKKIEELTHKILPAGASNLIVLAIQNVVIKHGIFARLAGVSEEPADFLQNRIVSGPIPAVVDMTVDDVDGKPTIVSGEPTWEGQSIAVCQSQIATWGLTAFRAEAQHETDARGGGMFDHLQYRHCKFEDVPWGQLTQIAVACDPAVTTTDQSDSQAVQADGITADGAVYRLRSWEERATPVAAIKVAVAFAIRFGTRKVIIESDQGGDTWNSVYSEAVTEVRADLARLAAGGIIDGPALYVQTLVEIDADDLAFPLLFQPAQEKAGVTQQSKAGRAQQMLAAYETRPIFHVLGTHLVLERGLNRFPRRKPFDIVDAAYWSLRDLLKFGQRSSTSGRRAASRQLPAVKIGVR